MAVAQAATNERSLRSVFVGNIPYDASEEKLKDIFSEVGPVLSFKLVYDRESGKPKGYGFCEYRDQETASSAMRNLNGYELNGRNLRVDTATNERFKEEMKNLQMSLSGNSFESPYGQEIDPEKTPETIAKVVASLPPEQMFELTRQMKHCVLTNPNEARNMLLQNPQLAYALLQALVVMKAVDVNSASSILYKPNPAPISIPPGNVGPVPGMPAPPSLGMPQPMPHGVMPNQQPPPQQMPMPPVHQNMYEHPHDPHVGFNRPPMGVPGGPPPPQHQNFDQRHIDPRLRQNDPRPADIFDPRVAAQPSAASAALDPRLRAQGGGGAMDPRQAQANVSQPPPGMRGPAPAPVIPISQSVPGGPQAPFGNRFGPPPSQTGPPIQVAPGPAPGQPMGPGQQLPPLQQAGAGGQSQSEQEKANLIMQVLALSDQQIAMLPAEQRQSIMQLKEQLTRGGQA